MDEEEDLKKAYEQSKGALPLILEHIPHATHNDEDRLITTINNLIESGALSKTKNWTTTSTDKSAKAKRGKAASRQAKEAEEMAKELGVWDEFYGTGKKGKRQGDKEGEGSGEGGLQALILQRQKDRAGALDAMEAKYAKIEEEEKARRKSSGKKRKSDARVSLSSARDRREGVMLIHQEDPGEMDDAAFEALQAKMFGKKEEGKKSKKSKP